MHLIDHDSPLSDPYTFLCSLCSLYSWRYDNLGNLPHVLQSPEYQVANSGFAYDYQLIDVQDFNGIGESEPTPYFYQVIEVLYSPDGFYFIYY